MSTTAAPGSPPPVGWPQNDQPPVHDNPPSPAQSSTPTEGRRQRDRYGWEFLFDVDDERRELNHVAVLSNN